MYSVNSSWQVIELWLAAVAEVTEKVKLNQPNQNNQSGTNAHHVGVVVVILLGLGLLAIGLALRLGANVVAV